jgi:RES domain-containing protein
MITWRLNGSDRVAVDEHQGRSGGRWHSAGRPLLYTADSSALAVAEFLVHLTSAPAPLTMAMLVVPDTLPTDRLTAEELPGDWRSPSHRDCCQTGDRWLALPVEERAAILRVPSAVVPQQENWLIDPRHPHAAFVSVKAADPFTLDVRLVDPATRS